MTYYDILGMTPDATVEDIRIAWLRLAKRLHPDNQETGNEEKFKRAKEAYEVLSDYDKRAEYDLMQQMTGQEWVHPPAGAPRPNPSPGMMPIDWDAMDPSRNDAPLHEVVGAIMDGLASSYLGRNPLLRAVYRGVRPKIKNELRRTFREEDRPGKRRKVGAR